jgi:hypothetical protein
MRHTREKIVERNVMIARHDNKGRRIESVNKRARCIELRPPCALCDVAGHHHEVGPQGSGETQQCFHDRRLFGAKVRI